MKYDLTKFPISDDDKQLQDELGNLVTYRKVLINAALFEMDGNGQPVRGESKLARFAVYMKLKKATDSIDLDVDEIKLLADASLVFPTLVAGQVRQFLDMKIKGI